MADTGSKTYLAKDSSAQEILNLSNNIALKSGIDPINSILNTGVKGTASYGYDFRDIIPGSLSGTTQHDNVTITGKGMALIRYNDTTSESNLYFTIDGVKCTVKCYNGLSITLPFQNSLVIWSIYYRKYGSMSYAVYVE